MRLDGRPDARAEDLDLALVARLDRRSAYSWFGRLATSTRWIVGSEKTSARSTWTGSLLPFLVDEIEIGQRVGRRQVRRVGRRGSEP